ncbi:MAG: GuaB3 family IMP dehydrogenase-related protein, partial [Chloroflexi bacterium]|nr:GuaB3 family IMP dehydrogenase-related protein [Chloroflexota bacterium]
MKPKSLEHAYGFDDVAIVPGAVTTNPELVEPTFTLGDKEFATPVLASAMDGVVDPKFAVRMSEVGGLGVLNLDGLWAKYEDADSILEEIATADLEESTRIIQRVYQEPTKDHLVGERIEWIKAQGGTAIVSVNPQNTKRLAPITKDAGVDVLVVAST